MPKKGKTIRRKSCESLVYESSRCCLVADFQKGSNAEIQIRVAAIAELLKNFIDPTYTRERQSENENRNEKNTNKFPYSVYFFEIQQRSNISNFPE